MTESTPVESIFFAALQKPTPAERAAYLDEACGGDLELRRRVEWLLAAHPRAESFLADLAAGAAGDPGTAPLAAPAGEQPGDRLGPYKLLQKLGEGGMGEVWVAEQTEPVQRRVAVKVIRPGRDSARLLARFEQERQALALMDHPNIAKVFDAGVTNGTPYFVMELIQGVPITRYCDEAKLSPRQRLELFVPVCQAVQHAHQKGVIHRDLKPSNILVALYDGRPVPKVIDFGVAKATGPRLSEESIYTEVGSLIGTLEYMSPEQAELNNLDIDTRTDVYALGVVLYELLTGSVPFSRKQLQSAAFAEMLRIIKEEEPPRPSTRLSGSDELPGIAAVRQTEPRKLPALVRGELDWIVMKCLEKDRGRRYETANGLALDVQRYLADEPVVAGPPSRAYRLRKFVRRHRVGVTAASAILLSLVGGIAGTTWGLMKAERARRHAEQAAAAETTAKQAAEASATEARKVLEFVEQKVFAAARPQGRDGGLGRDVSLRAAIEAALPYVDGSFTDQPLVAARLHTTLGISSSYLGDAKTAAEQHRRARAIYTKHRGPDHPETLASLNNLANSYHSLGLLADALRLREETLARRKARLGPDHPDTLGSMHNLANSYYYLGRHADALKLREESLALMKAKLGPDHPNTLMSMHNLAVSYNALGRHADSLTLLEETLALRKARLGPDHPDTVGSMHNLANGYSVLGRHADALTLHEETLARRRAKLGPDHPDTLRTMGSVATGYAALGRHADALTLHEETLALQKVRLGPDHPDTLLTMLNLTGSYAALGRHADALTLREETLARRRAKLGPDHPETLRTMGCVAESLVRLGRGAEAVPIIDECLRQAAGKAVDPKVIPGAMGLRLQHFQNAKDAAGCRATAEMWEKLNRTDAAGLYNAACFRAVAAAVIKVDPKTPGADATRLAQEEADRAMDWLKKAVAAGYKDAAHMTQDTDLDVLRDRADFRKLVAQLEAAGEKGKK
jgi:serine/threonine protein kinase/tetratricopeptide (TPR) repeat protein